jgi:DMSO/TMAO reductase YedYZ molybdopterin-dependent catalytic subunit
MLRVPMVGQATHRRPQLRLRELLRGSRGAGLPPGQRAVSGFPRFSRKPLQPLPPVPANPELRIMGAVATAATVPIAELRDLAHQERVADFNCVTTWSVRGLRWGGVPFPTFYEGIIVARCQPSADVRWLRLLGLDGATAVVALEDAPRDDVLLADSLDGEPLTLLHGAPIRFVSPA